jgi:hypothetical protein
LDQGGAEGFEMLRLDASAFCVVLMLTPLLAQADDSIPPPELLPPRMIIPLEHGPYRARVIQAFKRDLRRTGSRQRVEGCVNAIDYIQPSPLGKDTSWGLICRLAGEGRTQRRLVMACDDRLVGKFSMVEVKSASADALISFTGKHCPPGG